MKNINSDDLRSFLEPDEGEKKAVKPTSVINLHLKHEVPKKTTISPRSRIQYALILSPSRLLVTGVVMHIHCHLGSN